MRAVGQCTELLDTMEANMSERRKVVLDAYFRKIDEIFDPQDLERLHSMADVIWGRDEPMPSEEFAKIKGEAFAIITGSWRHGGVDDAPKLHAIIEVGGRHPSPKVLDYRACFARGIRVLSCAPAFGPMVAEAALAMALAASRDIVTNHEGFHTGEERYLHAGNVGTFTLYDETVGFIGFGGLAKNLKPLLDPFRCKILAYDPWLPASYLQAQGVTPVSLEALLAGSKVVFVLAIPSLENKAMLDRAHLSLIQPGAVLVLISRSHVVDFDALTELLYEGRFKAAIDVFPQEPLPRDHPIRNAPNVVLAGHRAGSVRKDLRLIGHMVVDDIEAMLAGLPPWAMQVAQPEIVFRLE
jgi:phosphoglycerate dehydrogenase-like enzyme